MRRLFGYNAASAGLLMLMATFGTATAQEFAGREKLRSHSAEFRREVIKVTNGVWVAVGFSDANSVLIEGEGGSIVVDTTSDVEDARAVKAEFAKLSTAPVRAIIYTHSHPDHTGGGGVFAGNDGPEILAHRLLVDRVPDVGRNGRDGGDQFGSTLPDALFINAGTGLEFGRHPAPSAYVAPTRTFSGDRLELTIAGVRLQLFHTPGETRENVADFQWAAELTDYVLAIDDGNVEARRLKAAALGELGERQISAIARNYYLSAAQYLLRDLPAR